MLVIEISPNKVERYLVELEFPSVRVRLGPAEHVKELTEDDLRYLVASQFKTWKSFVMTRYFRLELNIGQEEPLPRIQEEEDQQPSEVDLRDLYPPTQEEMTVIE